MIKLNLLASFRYPGLVGGAWCLTFAACAESPVPAEGPITDANQWLAFEPGEDPFLTGNEHPSCSPTGVSVEFDGIEVNTDFCPWFSRWQPSSQALVAGQTVSLSAWHSRLVADEPAEGQVIIRIGDDIVMHWVQAIPSDPDIWTVQWTVPNDLPVGSKVQIHVHNHGANSWTIGPILAAP